MTTFLRRATFADAQLLATFGALTFSDAFSTQNDPQNMTEYLAASFSPARQSAELAEPGSIFLIAEQGEQTVGYARLFDCPPPSFVDGLRPLELVRFYTHRSVWGQGVAGQLMQGCIDEAKVMGFGSLWLSVWQLNARAIAFYHKWGFTTVGEASFILGKDVQTDFILQSILT